MLGKLQILAVLSQNDFFFLGLELADYTKARMSCTHDDALPDSNYLLFFRPKKTMEISNKIQDDRLDSYNETIRDDGNSIIIFL